MSGAPDIKAIAETDDNMCRIFELPESYPSGYCFGGGKPVNFQMVDWFQPISAPGVFDEIATWAECMEMLLPFLQDKQYVQAGRTYLCITNFGESFIFEGGNPAPASGRE